MIDVDAPTVLTYARAEPDYDCYGNILDDDCEGAPDDEVGSDTLPRVAWERAAIDVGDGIEVDPEPMDPDDTPF